MTKSEIIALITPTVYQVASQYTDAQISSLAGQIANDIADAIIQSEDYTDNKFLQVSSASLQGVAQPSDNPGANVQGRWWMTAEPGVYTNFGITVDPDEWVAILDNGISYEKVVIPIDISGYIHDSQLGMTNLVKPTDFLVGYQMITNIGVVFANPDTVTTELIDVSGLTYITITKTNAGAYIVCYDATQTYIGRVETVHVSGNTFTAILLPDTKYVRYGTVSNSPATRTGDIAAFGIYRWGIDFNAVKSIAGLPIVAKSLEDYTGIYMLEQITVKPLLEPGTVSTSTGWPTDIYYFKPNKRTSRFIRVKGNTEIAISISIPAEYRVNFYDKDFNFISATGYSSDPTFGVSADAYYCKITFRKSSLLEDLPLIDVYLTGYFQPEFEFKNVRRSNGYERLTIPVNVVNPHAADDTSNDVQDYEDIKVDYGLMCLPETYSNIGEPTRLIIYCHGSGVNYTENVTSFPATDIQPEYFLKEGYAVMDIEGNPFNNTIAPGYIPQLVQSYIAAYEWIIKNYNIKTDGVFLAGRSMGGGSVLDILRSRIPVVAAACVVPSGNNLARWNYSPATRRQFMAEHMGFTGTPPTWTNNNPMTLAEWNYLYDNFDKLVKYSPHWAGITNLPDRDTLFDEAFRVSSSTPYVEAEDLLYSTLRYKTKAPVKFFAVKDDTTAPWRRNAELMYKMIKNGGGITELRLFEEGGHHFEIDNPDCLTTVTTRRGEVLNNIPVVYIEMLQFWRRYEVS